MYKNIFFKNIISAFHWTRRIRVFRALIIAEIIIIIAIVIVNSRDRIPSSAK